MPGILSLASRRTSSRLACHSFLWFSCLYRHVLDCCDDQLLSRDNVSCPPRPVCHLWTHSWRVPWLPFQGVLALVGASAALSHLLSRRISPRVPALVSDSHSRLFFSNPVWTGANTIPSTLIRNITAISVCSTARLASSSDFLGLGFLARLPINQTVVPFRALSRTKIPSTTT